MNSDSSRDLQDLYVGLFDDYSFYYWPHSQGEYVLGFFVFVFVFSSYEWFNLKSFPFPNPLRGGSDQRDGQGVKQRAKHRPTPP